jgi:hypothetical protein
MPRPLRYVTQDVPLIGHDSEVVSRDCTHLDADNTQAAIS